MLTMQIIVLAVLALVVLFVIGIALRSGDFRITRSAVMNASPQAVFEQVNDFHRWDAWSPWDKIDPTLQRTYEGPPAGLGSIYSWVGNNKVGAGRMTILESRPGELIRIKLEFLKPFVATNTAEFLFKPQGNQTVVTWTMTGTRNFMMKLFSMMMDMDKLVGGDFEKGLASMKALVERTGA